MTNEQLVARIQAGEDVAENMKQLYDQVKAFIHIIANRYRYSGMAEDLEQEGYLALYPAIDGYDPAHGVKFLTYAEKWIRQRMQRYLQMNGASVRLSAGRAAEVKRFNQVCSQFHQVLGREATNSELARILGVSLEEIKKMRQDAQWCNISSLSTPTMGTDGQIGAVGDLLPSDENLEEEVVARADREQLQAALWGCVDELPADQAAVIRKKYKLDLKSAEIARELNIGRDQVTRLHNKAINSLWKKRGDYSQYLPEYWQAKAYQGCGVGAFNRTWTSSTEKVALQL